MTHQTTEAPPAESAPRRDSRARPTPDVSPIRRQYLQIKQRFPDTLLFFRLGDFYETFERDAEIASAILDITLTSRELGRGDRVAMAGIPHHAAENHVARLVAAGHKVAICDQIAGPGRVRGLIDRDVTRVVTPGTVTEPAMLDSRRNTYIAAVIVADGRCGVAYADLSTGEFAATELDDDAAAHRELLRLGAAELVLPANAAGTADPPRHAWIPEGIALSFADAWSWRIDRAADAICRQFDIASIDGLGLGARPLATRAAGGLLAYLAESQRSRLAQLEKPRFYAVDAFMALDAQARKTLELAESSGGERRHGLAAVIDETRTPMGARLLRRWLSQPLLDLAAISQRQNAIASYVADSTRRGMLRRVLANIHDIERLANRALSGACSARELVLLRRSLMGVAEINAQDLGLTDGRPPASALRAAERVAALLLQALVDEPPPALGTGESIRPGFAPELDAHQRSTREAREWIAGLERQERERTGIRSLKVGYNRVFGYYLEVSAAALAAAERDRAGQRENGPLLPSDYQSRQSLTNCTRYVTPTLKEYEARVISAQETLASLEEDVFHRVVSEVASQAAALREVATAIAELDVVAGLAEVAANRHYVRPTVDDSRVIDIVDGRHPTLERLLPAGEFVANDTRVDGDREQITILTGPNMAGKSSWLRQSALIVLLAQIGSFVPARAARIGIVDRIFTRIGAQDDIAAGQSTFMVEMLETASILNQATPRSLVLLDEIGRGTSTWDGLAIARAVVEHLHNAPRLGCRTLFATHFHELTELASVLPRVHCARMEVLEEGDRVVFLHRIVPGAADRSYGIHVADLAGLPRAVTRRAREILKDLERPESEPHKRRRDSMSNPGTSTLQLTLFAPPSPLLEAVKALDVEALSPLEALTRLYELKQLAESG